MPTRSTVISPKLASEHADDWSAKDLVSFLTRTAEPSCAAVPKVLFAVDSQSPSMRELAQRLVTTRPRASDPHAPVLLVNEDLRLALTQLVGAHGLASLLRRALALATADMPALKAAKMGLDGRLEADGPLLTQAAAVQDRAALAITTQLLELLVTFIGEFLTRRIVLEACPESPPGK